MASAMGPVDVVVLALTATASVAVLAAAGRAGPRRGTLLSGLSLLYVALLLWAVRVVVRQMEWPAGATWRAALAIGAALLLPVALLRIAQAVARPEAAA